MTTPKTEIAWAVYGDDGNILYKSVSKTESGAQNKYSNSRFTSWDELQKRGYTVRKVLIEVVK